MQVMPRVSAPNGELTRCAIDQLMSPLLGSRIIRRNGCPGAFGPRLLNGVASRLGGESALRS